MNKTFLKRRFLKLGILASTFFFGQGTLKAEEVPPQDESAKASTKSPVQTPLSYSRFSLEDKDDEANNWHINTQGLTLPDNSTDNFQPGFLKDREHFFSISGDGEAAKIKEESVLKPNPEHAQAFEQRADSEAWNSEVNDPGLLFYPGVLPSVLPQDAVNTKQNENREIAEAPKHTLLPPSFDKQPAPAAKTAQGKPAENPIAQAAPLENQTSPVVTPNGNASPIAVPAQAQNELQASQGEASAAKPAETLNKTILINFNNVSIIEFIRFVSRISNKNFVFDENDLQFNVTIISEEATTIENVMTALLQELRIRDLMLLEQGNTLVIHKNLKVNSISKVVDSDAPPSNILESEIVTQVFRLNTLDPEKAAAILKPLSSDKSIIEVLKETNTLVVTDLISNVKEIAQLLKSLDAPKTGFVIGQYVVRNAFVDNLIQLAQRIMQPIAHDQPVTFVPHTAANSIFVISTPYLVERTISILQYLDQFQGSTRILNPKDLKFEQGALPEGGVPAGEAPAPAPGGAGQWERDAQGNWQFRPTTPAGTSFSQTAPPEGRWLVDSQGNWYFQPGGAGPATGGLIGPGGQPEGQWVLNSQGIWVYQLAPGRSLSPERLTRQARAIQELPPGHIERTQFYIHKLRYRRGDQIEKALGRIALSMEKSGSTNLDLLATIASGQWLEASNSIVFSGTPSSIEKIRELIDEIDTPLRQVFLEMLILGTSLDDSLRFSVNLGSRFGGGQGGGLVAGAQGFLTGASTVPNALDTADMIGVSSSGPVPPVEPGINPIGIATASQMVRTADGYTLGLIGQSLHHDGQTFTSIGALVKAVHNNTKVDIILNPKILTEDNATAEIFVGINTQFPTQAISNDRGSVITQNFEYRDVGTRLKVTPIISSNDIITLEIEEEVSNIASQAGTIGNTNQVIGPTTNKSKTTTKIHVPNKYFVILSGLMNDQITRGRINVPCLGGVPLIGALFSDKQTRDQKSNLMVFIRPEIIDSENEITDLTKRQQDIFRIKKRTKKDWIREDQETLDWLNLKNTDWQDEEASCE